MEISAYLQHLRPNWAKAPSGLFPPPRSTSISSWEDRDQGSSFGAVRKRAIICYYLIMSCHQTRSLLHAQHLDFWKLIKILKSQQSKSSQWKQHRDDQSRHPLSPFDPNRSYGATALRRLSGSGALMVGHEEQRTKPLGGWSAMVTWLKQLQFGIHYYSELFH